MMSTKKSKKLLTLLLAASLLFPMVSDTAVTAAAKKPKLSLTKITALNTGKTRKLQVKNNGVKKIVKVTWRSSSKSNVTVSKNSGKSITVKAVKAGKSTITATVKYKIKVKSKTLSKKLKCTVTVVDNAANPAQSVTNVTNKPSITPPTVQPTAVPTTGRPTISPLPPADVLATNDPSVTPGPANLLSALSKYVKNVGTCISYGNSWGGNTSDVADANTTKFIKENYNSLTAENQMKPESILGFSAKTIKTSEASGKGYYVPADYKETTVPTFDYSKIDTLMKYAHDNGIRIRYHGLLWHEQTSNWFFRENYDASKPYVTPEVMDARIEYYIKNVMDHVYTSQYKDTVYCWDVVNEFYHMTECIYRIKNGKKDKTDNVKCYYEVYGKDIFEDPSNPEESHVKTNPAYVKKAFKWAYEELVKYNLTDSVELVYNDYDTNYEDVRASILAVTKFINQKDDLNPNGDKFVTTIGMQTHDKLSEKYSYASHKASMTAFRESGLNLQITEMDLALNSAEGHTKDEQLEYWSDFISLVILECRMGANFTGITWWGMTDSASWLGNGESPLLCGTSITDKKEAYFTVINTGYKYK